jgi:hypothetical protein
MRCLQTIKDVPYGSYEWCCNVVLALVVPLVSSHANFWPEVGCLKALESTSQQVKAKIDDIGSALKPTF